MSLVPEPVVEHTMKLVEGEIEVCSVCINDDGYPVAWELAHPYPDGQWAWGTRVVGWTDEHNGERILVRWQERNRTWRGIDIVNVWAESQIIDVVPVDRPADRPGLLVTAEVIVVRTVAGLEAALAREGDLYFEDENDENEGLELVRNWHPDAYGWVLKDYSPLRMLLLPPGLLKAPDA